jgi:hypothetical protein
MKATSYARLRVIYQPLDYSTEWEYLFPGLSVVTRSSVETNEQDCLEHLAESLNDSFAPI